MEAVLVRLLLALIAGIVMSFISRSGQIRVFVLVAIGTALVTVVSVEFFRTLSLTWYSDPARLSAQVVSAVGFIGSGLIWFTEEKSVKGISSASALWFTAIIGLLIGAGPGHVIVVAVLFVVILMLLDRLTNWEKYLRKRSKSYRDHS